MRSRHWLISALCAFMAVPAGAQSADELTLLTGQALTDAFAGRTHYGTYKEFRDLTGTNKFTEKMSADGATDYKEGDMRLTGKWRVINEDQMCFLYDDFPGLHCFVMFQAGTCIYGYGPEFVRNGKPIRANGWSVKSVRDGDISTCDDLIG